MKLSKKDINNLLQFIGLTKEKEINCEQCLMKISEYVEKEMEGKSIQDVLQEVHHHLSICGECNEEYEILKKALSRIDS